MYWQSFDFRRMRFSGMGKRGSTAAQDMDSQGNESEFDTF